MSSNEPDLTRAYRWFCEQVYSVVRSIPPGRVMTYGGIAAVIPKPKGMDPLAYKRIRARWAGYALKKCPDDVPWWRVVNRHGEVSPRIGHGPHIQQVRLEEEGIPMDDEGILNFDNVLWDPSDAKQPRL